MRHKTRTANAQTPQAYTLGRRWSLRHRFCSHTQPWSAV